MSRHEQLAQRIGKAWVDKSTFNHTPFNMLVHEPDYREALHNELQRIDNLVNLWYEFDAIGPLHEATWTATARSKSSLVSGFAPFS